MLLIADSGSSKTGWRLIDTKGNLYSFYTEGLNPFYKTVEEIKAVIHKGLIAPMHGREAKVSTIYFYGAGCSVPTKCAEVKKALADCFAAATIYVEHDILGAARACCANEKGIVCIMGTGSNSCYYDGTNTTKIIGGLGYMLGDEGSGCHIGKTLVAAYLNEEIPEELHADFTNTYHLDRAAIYKKVYDEPNANRFLASFSMFTEKHKTSPFIKSVLENCFTLFIDKHICRYPDYTNTTAHFVGSVAYHHKAILIELCKNKGIKTGKFVLEPVEELAKFHSLVKN